MPQPIRRRGENVGGGPGLISKVFETKLSMQPGEKAVIARISTTAVDRDGDVMLPSGVDLRDFNKNPVVLFGHDSFGLPIGKAVGIKTRTNDIVAKIVFAERPDSMPDVQEFFPDTVHAMFQQDILKAFSVGFTIDDERPATKRDINRFGEDVRRIITRWKLLEFSVVTVPSNQDALATAVSKQIVRANSWAVRQLGTIDDDQFGEAFDQPSMLDLSKHLKPAKLPQMDLRGR